MIDIFESEKLKEAIQNCADKHDGFDVIEDNCTFSHGRVECGKFSLQRLVSKIFRSGINANENNQNLYWCDFNDGENFYYLLGQSHDEVVEQVKNWSI